MRPVVYGDRNGGTRVIACEGTTFKGCPFESTSLLTSRKCHAAARRRKMMMRIFHLFSMALVTSVEDGH